MIRLSLALISIAYTIISTGVVFAQGDLGNQAETGRGLIADSRVLGPRRPPPPPPKQGGNVYGEVVEPHIGEDYPRIREDPIENVRVVIVAQGGTEFTTTTEASGYFEYLGIPAGRYLISIYKKGYGDRLGKPVTVVNGGNHGVSLQMVKKDNILIFFKKFGFVFWALILCAITALLTFLFTKRWMAEKLTTDKRRGR